MNKKWVKYLIGVAVIVLLGLFFWKSCSPRGWFGREEKVGAIAIKDIRLTEKIKTLTMYKEILVNEFKAGSGIFNPSEDQICAIYPCRLDFGFDMTKCDSAWIQVRGDSTYVTLPSVEVLNRDYSSADETKKRVPIQSGSWTVAEVGNMQNMASAMMKRSCEADNCYELAEEQGKIIISNLLSAFGLKNLVISIKPRKDNGLYRISPEMAEKNPYTIKVSDNGLYTFRYLNGAVLYASGDLTSEEMLAFADLWNVAGRNIRADYLHVHKVGKSVNLAFMHKNMRQGSYAAEHFVKSIDPRMYDSLFNLVRERIVGEDIKITGTELDQYRQNLYTYK